MSIDGDCVNRDAVTIATPTGATAFSVQDFAILGIQCVVITGGSIGLMSRQFSIIDYVNITFGPMDIHVAAGEASKINCGGGTQIIGDAVYHYAVSQKSQVEANCDITITNPVSFSSFAWVVQQSLFDASGATFRGAGVPTTTGLQYIADDLSLVVRPSSGLIPGNGSIVQGGAVVQ